MYENKKLKFVTLLMSVDPSESANMIIASNYPAELLFQKPDDFYEQKKYCS